VFFMLLVSRLYWFHGRSNRTPPLSGGGPAGSSFKIPITVKAGAMPKRNNLFVTVP
jgi:hypothetical protein